MKDFDDIFFKKFKPNYWVSKLRIVKDEERDLILQVNHQLEVHDNLLAKLIEKSTDQQTIWSKFTHALVEMEKIYRTNQHIDEELGFEAQIMRSIVVEGKDVDYLEGPKQIEFPTEKK